MNSFERNAERAKAIAARGITETKMNVRGTEVDAGDRLLTGHVVLRQYAFGRVDGGAQYLDVLLDNGNIERCWEGFEYSVMRPSEVYV